MGDNLCPKCGAYWSPCDCVSELAARIDRGMADLVNEGVPATGTATAALDEDSLKRAVEYLGNDTT